VFWGNLPYPYILHLGVTSVKGIPHFPKFNSPHLDENCRPLLAIAKTLDEIQHDIVFYDDIVQFIANQAVKNNERKLFDNPELHLLTLLQKYQEEYLTDTTDGYIRLDSLQAFLRQQEGKVAGWCLNKISRFLREHDLLLQTKRVWFKVKSGKEGDEISIQKTCIVPDKMKIEQMIQGLKK